MSETLVTIAPEINTKKLILPEDGIRRSFKGLPIRTLQGLEHRVVIPENEHGLRTSPLEAGTGVPLPILGQRSRFEKDYHHGFFYKKLFEENPALEAVRLSRIQLVGRFAHMAYHREFDGTRLPEDNKEAFNLIILNLAGYVPDIGVEVRQAKQRKRRLEPAQVIIRPLRNPENFSLRKPDAFMAQQDDEEQKTRLSSFIEDYAKSDNFEATRLLELEEFMDNFYANSTNQEVRDRQLQLAFRLTAQVLKATVKSENPAPRLQFGPRFAAAGGVA